MTTRAVYRSIDAHTGAISCAGCIASGLENVRLSRALEAQRELTYKHAEAADQAREETERALARIDELEAKGEQ